MSNRLSSHRETEIPESSDELRLLVGIFAFGVLLLVLFVVGWAVSGWSLGTLASQWIHPWWLVFTGLIRRVFTMVLAGAVVVGGYLITLALGSGVLAVWRRLRSPH